MKTKTKSILTLATILLMTASFIGRANAAIIVVAPTASAAGSFEITDDIVFTITTSGDARVFVLNEWVIFDGFSNPSKYSPNLAISFNGSVAAFLGGTLIDNSMLEIGQLTRNDGYFLGDNNISLNTGDTLTLKAGSYSLGVAADFNPQATQTFTGSMFIADGGGNQLSNTILVPEPSTTALLFAGAVAAFTVLRRRKK